MKLTLLLISLIFGITAQKLSVHEVRAISDVVKSLMVSFITMSTENPILESATAMKIFSDNGIAINIQRPEDVSELVKETIPEFPTIIILRPRHFKHIFVVDDPNLRPSFKTNETRKRLRRDHWNWMMLLQPGEEFLEDGEIPFSVEFVILEPNSDGFNVWEQYHIFINQRGKKTESVRTLMARWFPDTRIENELKSTGLVISPRNVFLRRDMKNSSLIVNKCRLPAANRHFASVAKFPLFSEGVVDAMKLIFNFKEAPKRRDSGYDIQACDVTILGHMSPPTEIWKWAIGPLMKLKVSLYYEEPPVKPLESYALEPFEPDVWAALAGWIIIAAFCVRLLHIGGKVTMSESIFQVIEAFFGQGNGAEGETNSTRLINTAIWFTVIAVTASYSAIILTFIMIRKPHVPFHNMDEFVKDGSYNYSGIGQSLAQDAHDMFPEDSAVKEAYRKYKIPDNRWVILTEDGVKLMCKNPKLAFLMFANHIEMEYWPCRLKRMRDPYFESDMGVPTNPIVPYVVAFNQKLPLLRSSGVMYILKRDFSYITFQRTDPDVPAPGIDLLKHVLMIVPVASCVSIFILALECLHKLVLDRKPQLQNRSIGFRLHHRVMNTIDPEK